MKNKAFIYVEQVGKTYPMYNIHLQYFSRKFFQNSDFDS